MDEEEKNEEQSPKEEEGILERLLKLRTIILSGEIDKSVASRIVHQLLILESEGKEPIRLYIDSPGGDVNAAFAIFDTIHFIQPPTLIIGMGLVASAGALVLLAAHRDQRYGFPNSHYLLHQPMSGMRGVATDIEIHAREIERTRTRINQIVAAECKKSLSQIEKDTDRDFWLNAEEAKRYGLIGRLVTSSTQMPTALAARGATKSRQRTSSKK